MPNRPPLLPPYADPVATRETLVALIQSSDDAIVSKDLTGKILTWNPAAERLFGYSAEEMIGKSILTLIPPERHSEETTILATLCRGDRVDHFETERLRKDGTRVAISLSVSPITDQTGKIVGAAKIARDITLRRQIEREHMLAVSEEARMQAERANAAKDEFLAMLGHELRNPLGAVANALRVLEAAPSPIRDAQARGIIGRQVSHLSRLVDDLLDVARVTTGKIVLNRKPVDVADALETAVNAVGTARGGVQPALRVSVDSAWVSADTARLEQILTNLLTNALKYTPPDGTVDVRVRVEDGDAVITVVDTGIGITAELLPHVFDLFVQGRRAIDRSQGGLGIGLTLVKRLVELHGGSITASSPGAGRGSTFTVRLPVLTDHPAMQAPPDVSVTDDRPLKILIIEDNPDARESLRLLLEVAGHDVHHAEDGPEGVESACRLQPDIALVDIGLPGFSGYDVAARLRALPETAKIILVALTGYGQPQDRERAFAAGFDFHLLKPIDESELRRVLSRARGDDQPRPQSRTQPLRSA